MRGSLPVFLLASLLFFSGSAAATAPLPVIEETVDVPNLAREISFTGVYYKDRMGPYCVRDIVCAGPFEPWVDEEIGRTGASVSTHNVSATGGHDPTRKERIGPYAFPTLLLRDDLRLCWYACNIPDSLYAHTHGNVTITAYYFGESYSYTVNLDRRVDTIYPDALPRSWCTYAQYTDC